LGLVFNRAAHLEERSTSTRADAGGLADLDVCLAEIVGLHSIAINGDPVALENVVPGLGYGREIPVWQVDAAHPLPFPLLSAVSIQTGAPHLARGKHQIEIGEDSPVLAKCNSRSRMPFQTPSRADLVCQDGKPSRPSALGHLAQPPFEAAQLVDK